MNNTIAAIPNTFFMITGFKIVVSLAVLSQIYVAICATFVMVSKLYQHIDLNSPYTLNAEFLTFISNAAKFLSRLFVPAFLLLLNPTESQSQRTFQVNYSVNDFDSELIDYSDSTELKHLQSQLILDWQSRGYLTANYREITTESAKIELGQKFQWANLNISNEYNRLLSNMKNEIVKPTDLRLIGEKYVTWLENRGYPFAQVQFSNPQENEGSISLDIDIEKGRLIEYDSLIIKSEAKMSADFFEIYLNIKRGQPYQEKQIAAIESRLESLPYVEVNRATEISFHEYGATTYL